MKKLYIILIALLCFSACKIKNTEESIISSNTESPSFPENSSEENISEISSNVLSPELELVCEELRNSNFKLQIDYSGTTRINQLGDIALGEKLALLLKNTKYTRIEPLTHGALEIETEDHQIQLQVIGEEHWTEICYYLLSDKYDDMSGKVYVEVIPSTLKSIDFLGYDAANAATFLYEPELYQKTDALLQAMLLTKSDILE